MPNRPAIARTNLHGEIVERLNEMLLDGTLRPGEKINEQALCGHFGVSRTPLREALKVLAASGLVVLSPNRGARVAAITREQIDRLFPIMGALEALAGETACARASDAEIARIRKLHEAMLGHYRNGATAKSQAANRAIHEAIFNAAGNPDLTQLYQTLIVRTHAARFTAQKSLSDWSEAVADHVAIIEALEARDGPRLAELLRAHVAAKAAMVSQTLDAEA